MYEFFIFDSDKVRIGILQGWDSVQWLEKYSSAGEVKIVAQATEVNKKVLINGNYVFNPERDTVAKIVEVEMIDEENDTLIVRAQLTAQALADRVVMATYEISNAEEAMYGVCAENARGFTMAFAPYKGFAESLDTQCTWGSVLEAEEMISENSGLGFKVVFDPEDSIETFTVYKGVDRSVIGPDYIGFFGDELHNVDNVHIILGDSDFKNVAIVAGEGDGADRIVRIVSLSPVWGAERKELYVDARDIRTQEQKAIDTGELDASGNPIYQYETITLSPSEYNMRLESRGLEKLQEHLKTFNITCSIVQNNILFGVDYFLGDRVPVKITKYGLNGSAFISSVKLIYETKGKSVDITLSDFILDPPDKVAFRTINGEYFITLENTNLMVG